MDKALSTHRIDLRPDLRKEAWGQTPMVYQGEIIGASDQPEYTGARWLLDNNAALPTDRLETWRGDMFCMSGIVGKLAKLTVAENKNGRPSLSLRPYMPFSRSSVPSLAADDDFQENVPRTIGGHSLTASVQILRAGCMTISGRQSRAARALLGISQVDLARMSKVSIARVTSFENGGECLLSTHESLVAAMEAEGARVIKTLEKYERECVRGGP